MFGLFKKTSWKMEGKALDFFRQVFQALPSEFIFLLEGLEKGLYRRFSFSDSSGKAYYSVSYDPMQSDDSMTIGKRFDLENIVIKQDGQLYPLKIYVFEGLLMGFEIERNVLEFKDFQVDLSSFKKIRSRYALDERIEKLVLGLTCKHLDLSDLSKIEIDGKSYFQIKDLEDGNFIAIDDKGQVFGLIHDPFKIELIHPTVQQFVADVNGGKFDFDEFLSGQGGH